MKFTSKSVAAIVVVVLLLALPVVISAAAPSVREDPGGTTVDGKENEWQVTPTDGNNPDWFSYTCTGAAGGGISCELSKQYGDLFLRYNCSSNSLFVLMYADRGKTYDPGNPGANWIKIAPQSSPVIQEGDPGWANLTGEMGYTGYEAVLTKDGNGSAFVPGTDYMIDFHSSMAGATSGTGETTVTLPKCNTTAVSLRTFTAGTNGGRSLPALPLLGVGMLALAAVVMVRRPLK
jgi:hypothetical protein